jgi:hypothetical protein
MTASRVEVESAEANLFGAVWALAGAAVVASGTQVEALAAVQRVVAEHAPAGTGTSDPGKDSGLL